MNLGDMTKNELEEFGRTVGIELDRRLNKADLLEQLIEHLQTVDETAEDDGVELDFIKPEEEWSEKDISHPLMPEVPEEVAVEVDPEAAAKLAELESLRKSQIDMRLKEEEEKRFQCKTIRAFR